MSSVSFLVYTLLCVGSCSTDSRGCGPKTGKVFGVFGRCKNVTVCNVNANLPKAAKFVNRTFSTLQMPPLYSDGRCVCPLRTATAYQRCVYR